MNWQGAPVARLLPGRSPLEPRIEVLPNDFLDGAQRERIAKRLSDWLAHQVARLLAPLAALREAPLAGSARGLAFRLVEALGAVRRAEVEPQVQALTQADRKALARLGMRFGVHRVFLPALSRPASAKLSGLLWSIHAGRPPAEPPKGAAPPADPSLPPDYWAAVGRVALGGIALTHDRVERLAQAARVLAAQGPFIATQKLVDLAGCRPGELAGVLADLGYRADVGPEGTLFSPRRREKDGRRRPKHRKSVDQASPFAPLAGLLRRP